MSSSITWWSNSWYGQFLRSWVINYWYLACPQIYQPWIALISPHPHAYQWSKWSEISGSPTGNQSLGSGCPKLLSRSRNIYCILTCIWVGHFQPDLDERGGGHYSKTWFPLSDNKFKNDFWIETGGCVLSRMEHLFKRTNNVPTGHSTSCAFFHNNVPWAHGHGQCESLS